MHVIQRLFITMVTNIIEDVSKKLLKHKKCGLVVLLILLCVCMCVGVCMCSSLQALSTIPLLL